MPEHERNDMLRVENPLPTAEAFTIAPRGSRFLFNERELAGVRSRISQPLTDGIDFRKVWERMIEQADAYTRETGFKVKYPSIHEEWSIELPLREPSPHPDPAGYNDFPYWTMFSRAIEDRLTSLSISYLVSGEAVYGDAAKHLLLALCGFSKWYEFDHRGAEGNLSNAHFTIGASIAYDSIHSRLSKAEQSIVRGALMEKGLQPMKIDFYSDDMHNIVAAKQVAMLYGSLAIADEIPAAGEYMVQAYAYIRSFLDKKLTLPETEGLLYDNVAAKHVLMAADVLCRAAGNETLLNHPYIREVLPERFLLFLAPGSELYGPAFPNLSDSFLKLDLSYMMSMLASLSGHPAAMWYIRTFEAEKPTVLTNLRTIPQAAHPEEHYRDSKSRTFSLIGWAALRSGWGEKDHLLCMTSSQSAQGHNHKDQNNIVLNVSGEWLLTNPGYQDYVPGPGADYTTGTVGHNSLLIDGCGQSKLGGGMLHSEYICDAYGTVSGDAGASYSGLADRYLRKTIHADNRYYLLIDFIRTGEGRKTELLFHTQSEIREEGGRSLKPGDAAVGNSVRIIGERSSLILDVLHPNGPVLEVEEYPGAEKYGPHIKISANQADSEGRHCFITMLVPEPAGDSCGLKASVHKSGGQCLIHVQRQGEAEDWHLLLLPAEAGEQAQTPGEAPHEGPISSDGEQAYVSVRERGMGPELSIAALVRGTELTRCGQPIIRSSLPVSATLSITDRKVELEVTAEAETSLRISLPSLDNSIEDQAGYSYDRGTGSLELTVPAGTRRLTFNLTETGR